MILGVHCDVRRGYLAALSHAGGLGAEAMQMFTYRRHHEPGEAELAEFRAARAKSGVRRLVLHVRYLPGLASEDEARRGRSIELLSRELRLAQGLGGDCLILHLGAYSPGSTREQGLRFAAEAVAEAARGSRLRLLVENVPGGGRRMGGSLEELAEASRLLRDLKVEAAACLDTAHAWAYGYDLSSREGMWSFLGKAHRLLGAENIPVFHLNDTRALLGSHREHHWHWGKGYLGTEGLGALLERPEYEKAVGILETPAGMDRENLGLVRSLIRA